MRESRAPVQRPPRQPYGLASPVVTAFDIADVLITVDGEEIRLGDYWFIARCRSRESLLPNLGNTP